MCYVCFVCNIRKYTRRLFMFLYLCTRAGIYERPYAHTHARARAHTHMMHDLCVCVQVPPSCLHARLKFIFSPPFSCYRQVT